MIGPLYAIYGIIWGAVAAFAMITAPIMAFGAILAAFGAVVIDGFGLTPGRMFEIAATYLLLAFGLYGIAQGIIFALPFIAALGAMIGPLWAVYGIIWAGVAAFAMITLPFVALGMVISDFGRAIIDDIGLNSSRMSEIRGTFTDLCWSINYLALGLAVMLSRLAVLGLLIWAVAIGVVFANLGVEAFNMMLKPMGALANSIMDFGTYLISGVGLDSGMTKEITTVMTTLADAINTLVPTIMSVMGKMAMLSYLYFFGFIIAGLANMGITGLTTLLDPLKRLAFVIADVGLELAAEINPKKAQDIADVLAALGDASESLMKTIKNTLPQLYSMAYLAVFGWIFAGLANMGVSGLKVMAKPLVNFATTVAMVGYEIMDVIDPSMAKMMVESMRALGDLSSELVVALDVMTNKLGSLVGGSWFSILPVKKIMWTLFMMGLWLPGIAMMINWGIVDPIRKNFQDPNALKYAAAQCQSMAQALTALPPVFDALLNGLYPLTRGGWFFGKSPISKILGMIPIFSSAFWAIASFLNQGVIGPIFAHFGNPQDLVIAAKACEGMAKVVTSLPPIIKTLADQIYPLVQPSIWGKTRLEKALAVARGTFGNNFREIARFVDVGIVSPIFDSGLNPRDLAVAGKAMEGLALMFTNIPKAINALVYELAPILRPGLWGKSRMEKALETARGDFSSNFAAIMAFVGQGILDPIFNSGVNPRDVSVAAKAMVGLAEMLPAIPKVISVLNGPIGQLSQPGIFGGKSRIAKTLEKLSESFKRDLGSIFSFIGTGILDPIFESGINPRDVGIAAKAMVGLAEMLPAIPAVIYGIGNNLAPLLSNTDIWGRVKTSDLDNAQNIARDFAARFTAIAIFLDTGIITPILANIGHPRDVQMAANTLRGMSTIIAIMPAFIRMLGTQVQAIMESKDMQMKMTAISTFAQWFANIADLLTNGMVIPIKTLFPPPEEVADMGNRLNGMSQVLTKIPQFMQQLYTSANATNEIPNFKEGAVTEMSRWFSNVASLISTGIVTPVQTLFPPVADITDAIARVDEMSKLMAKVPVFMSGLYGSIQTTLAKVDSGEIAQTEVTAFTRWFSGVAWLLDWGIVFPIKNYWPAADKIGEAITKVEAMGRMMALLSPFVDNMASAITSISNLTSGSSIYGVWKGLAGFMWEAGFMARSGLIEPLKYWPKESEVNEAIDKLTKLDELFRTMADAMAGVAAAAESMSKIDMGKEISGFNMPDEGYAAGIVKKYETWADKQASVIETGGFNPQGLKDANALATDQSVKNATALQGTMSELLNPKALSDALNADEIPTPDAKTGGITDMITKFTEAAQSAFGMGDTNALIDAISKQSPEITAMQTAMRTVDTYTKNIKDLFERSSGVINDIKSTTEYMSMFGNLDLYEKQIAEKIASSKQFVPTVQRIAESIGKGFDFSGGKAMVATIETQKSNIEEMKTGLQATEQYTKKLSDIFRMASSTIEQIKQTTDSLTALEQIRQVEANIQAKIASGNSFMTSVLRTVEAIATDFGTSEDMQSILSSVQTKIQQSNATDEVLKESLKFVDTIKQLQQGVLAVGQAAGVGIGGAGGAGGAAGPAAKASASSTSTATPSPVGSAASRAAVPAASGPKVMERAGTAIIEQGKVTSSTGGVPDEEMLRAAQPKPSRAADFFKRLQQKKGPDGKLGGSKAITVPDAPSVSPSSTSSTEGGSVETSSIMERMYESMKVCADSLKLMMTEATTKGSLYVADHGMVKTTMGTQETIVKGDNKLKEATLTASESTASSIERGNATLATTIDTANTNMATSIQTTNQELANSFQTSNQALANAVQQARTTSASEEAVTNASAVVGPQSNNISNLNAAAPITATANLSKHSHQGISPAAVAAGGNATGGNAVANANTALNAAATARGGNATGGAGGLGGVGSAIGGAASALGGAGGAVAGQISRLMDSVSSSSVVRGTQLGGGVPGAGMPHSIAGARVSLATPEPTQTATHTNATNSNIQSQVMQERATSRPPAAVPGVVADNKELQGIVGEGNATAEQMLGVLMKMYQMMVPKAGNTGGGPGETSNPAQPSPPSSYFRSPCGDLNSASGKGATNMARIR